MMYKYSIKIALIVIALFYSKSMESQPLTIDYTLEGTHITIADQTVVIPSTIIKSNNTISWDQEVEGNSNITNFTISATTGTWNPQTNVGELIHTLQIDEDHQASFTLTGTISGLSVSLSITNSEQSTQIYALEITSITYQ